MTSLFELHGIGEKRARELIKSGIDSVEALAIKDEWDPKFRERFGRKKGWEKIVREARRHIFPFYSTKYEELVHKDDLIVIKCMDDPELIARLYITNVLEFYDFGCNIEIEGDTVKITPLSNIWVKYFKERSINAKGKKIEKDFDRTVTTEQGLREIENIKRFEREFTQALNRAMRRYEEIMKFGKEITLTGILEYLSEITGNLYFDSFLAMVQQYALSDAPIVNPKGELVMSTGFNLALFGQPGTGKTFATVDLLLGNKDESIPPHGLPGLNRYCGGMTSAQFVRIGEAYQGRRYNFIVPEFNEWFKYSGMVEYLKQAMERKTLRYETMNEQIGPYKFDSFFSVNYNTKVYSKGYEVTIRDPNFNAIEDRMICRLHRMTKERYREILDSMERLMFGDVSFDHNSLRDHLVMIYAAETGKAETLEKKSVVLSDDVRRIYRVAEILTGLLDTTSIPFSPRIVKRTIQLASAMTLPMYFKEKELVVRGESVDYAIKFLIEEACVRAQEKIKEHEVWEEAERKGVVGDLPLF